MSIRSICTAGHSIDEGEWKGCGRSIRSCETLDTQGAGSSEQGEGWTGKEVGGEEIRRYVLHIFWVEMYWDEGEQMRIGDKGLR